MSSSARRLSPRARSSSAGLAGARRVAGARARCCRLPAGGGLTPGTTVDEAERRLIEITLEHTNGNKTRAADLLGISLKTLHNKLNRMKDERKDESEE